VPGFKMMPALNQVYDTVFGSKRMNKTKSIKINKLQKILDHCGETHLKAPTSAYGIKVFGRLEASESCIFNKEKKRKTKKLWTGSRNDSGERLHVDISLIRVRILEEPSLGQKLLLELLCEEQESVED
jgi:hypothetical protein